MSFIVFVLYAAYSVGIPVCLLICEFLLRSVAVSLSPMNVIFHFVMIITIAIIYTYNGFTKHGV